MNTFVLNAETSDWSIAHLLKQVGESGIEVRDDQGKVVAFVLSPRSHEALTYAEAHLDLDEHLEEIKKAVGRRSGITTAELLAKAFSAEKRTTDK